MDTPKHTHKILWTLIVLLLLVVVVGSYYWWRASNLVPLACGAEVELLDYAPTLCGGIPQNQPAFWKTYSNNYYSIKVPADWKEVPNNIGSGLDSRLAGYTYGSYVNLECGVRPVEECDPDAKPFVNVTVYVYSSSQQVQDKFKTLENAYYYVSVDESVWIIVDYDSLSTNSETFVAQNKPIVNKILSSFKFN